MNVLPRSDFDSTYAQLDATMYDRRSKPPSRMTEKKISSNTVISRQADEIIMRLHHTNILYFKPSGVVTINTGGWRTNLTHRRMNEFIGPHVSISGQTVQGVQITKAQLGGSDFNMWRHYVTYNLEDGMSFDLTTGVYVWDPYTWSPMEFASGMLSRPIIHAIDNLENDIAETMRRGRVTNAYIEEVVIRREQIEIAFNKAKSLSDRDIKSAEIRIATTLSRTLELFAAEVNTKLNPLDI